LLKSSARKKKIKLFAEQNKHIQLTADRNMMLTVIRNILSNAIKFTPVKGEIKIGLEEKPDGIEITITDNGIGMTDSMVNSLFKLDQYRSSTGTLGEKGTGLGLIICKEFVDHHSGQIRVESKEGKGTTVSVFLPH
jgi:signal transduction histidine kinase